MLTKTRTALTAATVVVALCHIAFAQSEKAKRIDEFVRPFVQANQFAGVILASENGRVIYEKAFGLANADYKMANEPRTRIGIASITKMMTSVILARLVEEKKLALEDKLSKYVPDFPNGDKITIQMLASHRSGIPHRIMPPEQEAVPHTPADMVERARKATLAFEPGSQRLYSSAGYTVLARVLEIASGKPYARLLDEYVFAPAGMRDSVDFDGETVIERRAQDYYLGPEGYINAALKDYSFLAGAGSVFSTAADLHRFGLAIVEGKFGAPAKASFVGTADNIAGSGSTNGHRSYLEVQKENKYGYVVLANLSTGAFDIIQSGVRAIMQGKDVPAAAVVQPKIIPAPKDLSQFLGHYRMNSGGSETEIVLRNDHLYADDIRLYPTAPDCFFDYKYFGTACFARDTTGKVKEMKWSGSGFDLTWTKQ